MSQWKGPQALQIRNLLNSFAPANVKFKVYVPLFLHSRSVSTNILNWETRGTIWFLMQEQFPFPVLFMPNMIEIHFTTHFTSHWLFRSWKQQKMEREFLTSRQIRFERNSLYELDVDFRQNSFHSYGFKKLCYKDWIIGFLLRSGFATELRF